jgi:hypothetical protein
VVEGARLESVYTGNRIEGSNPSVSAKNSRPAPAFLFPVREDEFVRENIFRRYCPFYVTRVIIEV